MSLLQNLFRRKSLEQLTDGVSDGEGPKLNKILTARDVFSAGVAAIIGTGIFVLTGVAANQYAGPGITLSFLLAGMVCAFVAFSYAELSSMIPVSGSAYTYAYATLGEIIAWIIGWDLLLEYAVGASAVAVGWSAYLQNVFRSLGFHLPDVLSHAPESIPWSALVAAIALIVLGVIALRNCLKTLRNANAGARFTTMAGTVGSLALLVFGGVKAFDVVRHLTSIDLPAILIIAFLNFWLVKGVKHTARMTAVFVVIKLAVIMLFIFLGIWHIHTANYHPFMPFGFHGVLAGAAIVFFAYIGFDAVTTLAEECKEPQKDVPKGVLGSLAVCTVLYLLVAGIMTGVMSYKLLGGTEAAAPMARVLDFLGYWWASPLVSAGAIAGITSVLIVLLFGQSRIMMRMSRDGLIAPVFGKIHAKYRTPVWSILIWGALIALTSGLLPIGELAELTNIGTLAAFVLVCVGVLVLRKSEPLRQRKFRCPSYPAVPPVMASLALLTAVVLPFVWSTAPWTASLLGLTVALTLTFWIPFALSVLFVGLHVVQRRFDIDWMPVLGALSSFGLMLGLPETTWLRFVIWMGIGLVIYGLYGRRHSLLNSRR